MYTQVPDFLYDKKIYNYLVDCVDNGAKSYSDINLSDKENIISAIIEVLGADSFNLLLGDDGAETMNLFSKYLKTNSKDDQYDFLSKLQKNAIEYYEYPLSLLVEEIKQNNKYAQNIENGLMPFKNMNTGEIEWRQFA